MLFDLRSRGRRRTVKTVYVFLALLMGAGLVLFGVGGAVSGGLLNAFDSSSGTGPSSSVGKSIHGLERAVRLDPKNAKAWGRLVTLRLQVVEAGNGNVDTNGGFTAKGKAALAGVDQAWNHYAALKPAKADQGIPAAMEQVYGPQALAQPANVVKVVEFELATVKKPGVTLYEKYAVYATLAGQSRKASLAQSQAETLAVKGKTGKARTKAKAGVSAAISATVASLNPSAASGAAQTVAAG